MSILIDILLDTVREEYKRDPVVWQVAPLMKEDMQFLHRECNQPSEFDPKNKRKTMFEDLVKGKAPVILAKCPYGQVTAVFEDSKQAKEIPWELWGRIFRMYHEKKKGGQEQVPFKVYFLANTSLRTFPPGRQPITPENINGGYTYPCNHETILLYRAEDATRVLLHELMHSCCLDNQALGVDRVEAETEAWAELVYVAFLSEGDPIVFNELLGRQRKWMVNQNEEVKKHMSNPSSKEFPWRYTLGKEEVWRRWGLISDRDETPSNISSSSSVQETDTSSRKRFVSKEDEFSSATMLNKRSEKDKANTPKTRRSLRLTFPLDNAIKRRFQVKESSTIL